MIVMGNSNRHTIRCGDVCEASLSLAARPAFSLGMRMR